MSRKKISVVGADYRAHYPRLYALTDEGGPRFEIQLSRHSAEKKRRSTTTFSRRDSLKTFSPKARPSFLSFSPFFFSHVRFSYIVLLSKLDGSKTCALARPDQPRSRSRSLGATPRDFAAPRIEMLCRFVELQQNIRSSWQ